MNMRNDDWIVSRAIAALIGMFLTAFSWTNGAASEMHNTTAHFIGGKSVEELFPDRYLAALAQAACEGDMASILQSLRAGVSVNGRGADGITPLLWAENCGNVVGMQTLLQAGANPNPLVSNRFNSVYISVSNSDPRILDLLLKFGGDPNSVDADGDWTALILAMSFAMDGNGWENYYRLLHGGANINLIYKERTVAEFAAALHRYDKVYELLGAGYNVRLWRLRQLIPNADGSPLSPLQVRILSKIAEIEDGSRKK